jgi:putative inorganic carbon (hco3(-)) transporter
MLSTAHRSRLADMSVLSNQRQLSACLDDRADGEQAATRERTIERVAFYLSWGSAASIIFSIALSQILLGLALVMILVSRQRLRFPPVKLPLALFFFATVLAVLTSVDPAGGWPQIRKFFVFGIMLVVFTTFKTLGQIRSLVLAWSGLALLSALASFVQLEHRHQLALIQNANDYGFYLDGRITGFASHWMTFGAEQMIVMLMLLSFLLFSPDRKGKTLALVSLPALWLSIVLGLTRSIFILGVPLGALYLLWNRKRWAVAVIALGLAVVSVIAPFHVRDRVLSVIQPHKEVDSNLRRLIMIRTGWEMVKAHPWLGIGPEQIKPQFMKYVPNDVSRPLPKGWYGHLHNMYLQYAAERGIPALLIMMWLIGRVARDFLRSLQPGTVTSEASYSLYGGGAIVLALLAEGLFEYNLGDTEVLTMFLTVVSCGYVAIESSKRTLPELALPVTTVAT